MLRAHEVLRARAPRARSAASRVERSLRQVLSEMGFSVTASPMPFRDAQLATGCPGTIQECGASVASAVDGERVAVSALEGRAGAPTLSITLYSFSASGEARQGSTELTLASPHEIDAAVRQLARSVYDDARPVAGVPVAVVAGHERAPARRRDTSATTQTADSDGAATSLPLAQARPHADLLPEKQHNRALWGAGWSTAALGSALLVSGIATNLAARGSEAQYADVDVRSTEDADRALANYERSGRQANAARVLYGAGGALLLTGAAMLIWGRLAPRRQSAPQLGAVPLSRGVAVSLTSNFEWGRL